MSHEHEHEHEHEHDHEYMHAHGIPHDHGAEQPHAHDHAHPHACDDAHGCPGAGDCARCDADPRAEVAALMRYMVNHNAAHAGELAQLAGKLKDLGDTTAYEQVMLAVSDFEKGNMRLSTVLAAMNPPA